jgi:LuxR family transcriptional regulator, maltose regulon positive regulatory protein
MTAVEPGEAARYSPIRWTTASKLIVRSRLHVPEAAPYHLGRERLSGLLASSTAPLTLLSAPAGSGKTALAAEWARRLDGARNVVWVNCHGGDGDPWADVARGMGGNAPEPAAARPPRRRRPARILVEQVLEAAGRSALPWTVFLDGYDVRSTDAAEELDRLLTYAGDELQVVLTSRADPILPLHRYRLDDALLEVRAADLAFTDAEAAALLLAAGVELAPDDLHALNERLAGWAAGLRFALPTLAGHAAPRSLVSSAVTYNGNINAYLVEEVLDAQPTDLRELILATSVPDTLPPGLLEELAGAPAAPTARRLMRANVFLERTPGDESCLRYVPFFRDLVRAQLAYEMPERFRRLQRTVAAWYAAHGGWEQAVAHLGHAEERVNCAALLVDHLLVGRLLCERRGDSFRRLIANTPSPTVAGASWHLLRAASALADGDHEGCSAHLDAAREAGVPEGRGAVTVAVLEAVLADAVPDGRRTEQLAARAEEALAAQRRPTDPGADDTAAVLLLARARAALRLGAVERADQLLEAALDSPTASWSATFRCLCLAHAALLHAHTGPVGRATEEADEAVAAAHPGVATGALVTTAHLARAYTAIAAGDHAGASAELAETSTRPDPLWQVVHAVVEAALERAGGATGESLACLDVAAAAAEQAGPWAADWVRQEKTHPQAAHAPPGEVRSHAGGVAGIPGQRANLPYPTGADGRVVEPLTPREVDVLAAMSEWLTTEEIAERLFVSVNTVRTHVRNILTKLGVSRRNAAIREAIRLGLLTPDAPVVLASSRAGRN